MADNFGLIFFLDLALSILEDSWASESAKVASPERVRSATFIGLVRSVLAVTGIGSGRGGCWACLAASNAAVAVSPEY